MLKKPHIKELPGSECTVLAPFSVFPGGAAAPQTPLQKGLQPDEKAQKIVKQIDRVGQNVD